MAISAVVSHRNFGFFIGSGRVCRGETPSDCQKCGRSSIGSVQCVNKKIFYSKLYHPRARFSFGRVYQSSVPDGDQPNREVSRSNLSSHVNFDNVLVMTSKKVNSMYKRVKNRGVFECRLSSAYSDASWIQTGKLDKLSFSNGREPPSKHSTVMRTRAEFKSEEHDVTRSELETLMSSGGASEAALLEGADPAKPWWKQFPKRWVMVLLCFVAFLLCNMDRVNMSIAILPMSKEFNWNSATVGLIQSSFFWGYLLTQIVGGIWADKIGGKLVLGFGVVWWSIATVLTPIAAKLGLPCLLVMRAFMGIGEGVAMPAMNNLLSRWIPVSERSRSLALVYSGMYLGSVAGLAVSPVLIQKFGWPSVFYSFGSLGSIWFALWLSKAHSSPKEDPNLSLEEKKLILGGNVSKEPVSSIPWMKILSKAPVWALIISHFCHNWGTFILLTWMPTYYNQVLNFNLTESGLLCVLPWLTMAVFANI